MYCSECGNKMDSGSQFCSQCGKALSENNPIREKQNTAAIVGFVFSFILGIVGLICSIIGYRNADILYNGKYKRLSLAGIMISEITITWQITFATFMATLLIIVLS
ncbi:MAG: zinc ribbon domain-containing protein [Bacteroides sp.]|nr:zinc ribbon domain-containing protein [Bacillota bacterium]MCM1393285.1 zinc ribbon domain-containing protein [[Eubacterium] siraeum]MCM1455412.1 zinc ribbon domain-containing protein [Bacteroides sp.]